MDIRHRQVLFSIHAIGTSKDALATNIEEEPGQSATRVVPQWRRLVDQGERRKCTDRLAARHGMRSTASVMTAQSIRAGIGGGCAANCSQRQWSPPPAATGGCRKPIRQVRRRRTSDIPQLSRGMHRSGAIQVFEPELHVNDSVVLLQIDARAAAPFCAIRRLRVSLSSASTSPIVRSRPIASPSGSSVWIE